MFLVRLKELAGIVTKVAVSEGQRMKKDDLLFVVVSMKMEVMIRALADGNIEQVFVTKDKEVVDGALLGKIKFEFYVSTNWTLPR